MQRYPYRKNKSLAPVNYHQVLDFRLTTETILSSNEIKVAKHEKAKKKVKKVKNVEQTEWTWCHFDISNNNPGCRPRKRDKKETKCSASNILDLECLTIRKIFLLLRGDGIVFFRMRGERFINSTIGFQLCRPPGKWVFSCVALFTDKQLNVFVYWIWSYKFVLKQIRHENTRQSKFMYGCNPDAECLPCYIPSCLASPYISLVELN